MFIDNERTRTGRATVTRAHAAALLRKVRKQRDEEAKLRQAAERCYSFFYVRSLVMKLAEADAATQTALEVAEREHKRAEAEKARADELREALRRILSTRFTMEEHRAILDARRLLAAHKERAA